MLSLDAAAIVAAVAVLVPLIMHLLHSPVPAVVMEIAAGIVIGPQVLGWARVDEPVRVLSVLGLAFLLFLAGLEIDLTTLRGPLLRLTAVAYAVSFLLALAAGELFHTTGLVRSPLLVAVILSATSLGIILPVLQDAGQLRSPFGRVVVAGASLAEVLPVVLLSVLFSEHSSGVGSQLVLLIGFLALVVSIGAVAVGAERSRHLSAALLALQDTTAEIRVRAAFALLILLAALATRFGLEAILGAFLAGATITLVDRDQRMTHTQLRGKLQAVGFGVFIPFFFVTTGMTLNVRTLIDHPATLARVPLFLAALLVARAVPAVLYRSLAQRPQQLVAAGLLQATSLSIPVVAGTIGVNLKLITSANYTALVTAGLLSVILFPLIAVPLLRPPEPAAAP